MVVLKENRWVGLMVDETDGMMVVWRVVQRASHLVDLWVVLMVELMVAQKVEWRAVLLEVWKVDSMVDNSV